MAERSIAPVLKTGDRSRGPGVRIPLPPHWASIYLNKPYFMEEEALLTWEAKLYEPKHKDVDWFWILWFIVLVIVVFTVYFGNYLFAAVVFLAGLTLSLFANDHAEDEAFALTNEGLYIDDTFIPYTGIKSFWVFTEGLKGKERLMLTLKRTFFVHMALPIGDVDTEKLRLILRKYVLEKKQAPILADEIMDWLKF
jgi:hypothetical protein